MAWMTASVIWVIDLLALRSGFAVTGRRCTVAELYR